MARVSVQQEQPAFGSWRHMPSVTRVSEVFSYEGMLNYALDQFIAHSAPLPVLFSALSFLRSSRSVYCAPAMCQPSGQT